MIALHLESVRCSIVQTSLGRRVTGALESRTGGRLAIEHIWGGIELISLICVLCGLGASVITSLVGIVYPAVMSIRAIETDDRDDDTEWLIYWVVFASFSVLDFCTEYLIYWIPFFFPLKLLLLVWLFSPESKGANKLYAVIMPLFRSGRSRELYASEVSIALDNR